MWLRNFRRTPASRLRPGVTGDRTVLQMLSWRLPPRVLGGSKCVTARRRVPHPRRWAHPCILPPRLSLRHAARCTPSSRRLRFHQSDLPLVLPMILSSYSPGSRHAMNSMEQLQRSVAKWKNPTRLILAGWSHLMMAMSLWFGFQTFCPHQHLNLLHGTLPRCTAHPPYCLQHMGRTDPPHNAHGQIRWRSRQRSRPPTNQGIRA